CLEPPEAHPRLAGNRLSAPAEEFPMPATGSFVSTAPPHATLEARQESFEAAWRECPSGLSPHWEEFLPQAGQSCTPEFVFLLLQTDIEFRVKAGLPALLAESYFGHLRLQSPDAHL